MDTPATELSDLPLSGDAPLARTAFSRKVALSLMMFLQHASMGAWIPIMPLHLQDIGFSGTQIGIAFATFSLASLASPWLVGELADRLFSARSVLAGSHALGAALLWWTASATAPHAVLALIAANALVFVPTLAVSNFLVLRNLADRYREFGYVRLWGTASWVVVGALLGLWLQKPGWVLPQRPAVLADGLRFGALLSVLLVPCCFLLPATQPIRAPCATRFASASALRMLRNRPFLVLVLASLAASFASPFVYPVGGLYLRSLGVSDANVAPLLSLGQAGEVAALLGLGWAVTRFGFKPVFLVGLAAWTVRFAIWIVAAPWPLVAASLPLHGLCYACVFVLGQMYADAHAAPDSRTSAQSLHLFLTSGIGALAGNVAAGYGVDCFTPLSASGEPQSLGLIFVGPAVGTLAAFVLFATAFKPTTPAARPPD